MSARPMKANAKKRSRRMIANFHERRRMKNINDGFEALKDLLPIEGEKVSKASILQHATDYIRFLLDSKNCSCVENDITTLGSSAHHHGHHHHHDDDEEHEDMLEMKPLFSSLNASLGQHGTTDMRLFATTPPVVPPSLLTSAMLGIHTPKSSNTHDSMVNVDDIPPLLQANLTWDTDNNNNNIDNNTIDIDSASMDSSSFVSGSSSDSSD